MVISVFPLKGCNYSLNPGGLETFFFHFLRNNISSTYTAELPPRTLLPLRETGTCYSFLFFFYLTEYFEFTRHMYSSKMHCSSTVFEKRKEKKNSPKICYGHCQGRGDLPKFILQFIFVFMKVKPKHAFKRNYLQSYLYLNSI